jgi:hypothetical protein
LLAGLYRTRTPPSEIAELISGIGWVSQLIAIAGGTGIFGDRASQGAAKDRVVTIDEVIAREPELIIGSWCGKKFRPAIEKGSDVEIEHPVHTLCISAFSSAAKAECGLRPGRKPWLKPTKSAS